MSYKSPIEILTGKLNTYIENDIYKVCQEYDIQVDKQELIRALNYDRGQYEAGYRDALKEIALYVNSLKKEVHPQDYNGFATLQGIKEYIEQIERSGV